MNNRFSSLISLVLIGLISFSSLSESIFAVEDFSEAIGEAQIEELAALLDQTPTQEA